MHVTCGLAWTAIYVVSLRASAQVLRFTEAPFLEKQSRLRDRASPSISIAFTNNIACTNVDGANVQSKTHTDGLVIQPSVIKILS